MIESASLVHVVLFRMYFGQDLNKIGPWLIKKWTAACNL